MSCKNFEAIISDLAREQMLEATVRQNARAHVAECKDCTALLEAERALTRGLHALAANCMELEAPAHIEANLLTEFRARKEAAPMPALIQMPQRMSRFTKWYPQVAAAAVLLMFAISGAIALRTRQGQTPNAQSSASAIKSNQAESQATLPSSNSLTPTVAKNVDEVESATPSSADSSKDREQGQKLSRKEVAALFDTAPRRSNMASVPSSSVAESRKTSISGEIATDFMPVAYGDNLNSIDSGRIVRVEIPRSALAQFGLPVNMERANERIKADVLIGEDGMARAIRFVR